MRVIFQIDTLLRELFPHTSGDTAALALAMKDFYTVGNIVPEVVVHADRVEVVIDTARIADRSKAFRSAVAACEAGRFRDAREQLTDLLTQDPTHTEYHRLLGQVCSELGDHDAAIDHLIDALRWDPKNTHALIMMGNLQAKHRADIDTAMRYFQAALEVDPNDHLAANNIAAQFLNLGKWDEAEQWFEKAIAIEPTYPNSHHGLAVVCERKGDLDSALFTAADALRHNPKRDELYRQSLALARHVAAELTDRNLGNGVVRSFCEELHKASGKPVRSVPDETIATAARLEVAERYNRPEHIVRYKPGHPCVEHLEVHELYHLRYITEARAHGANELFTASPRHRDAFLQARAKDRTRLSKTGIENDAIGRFLNGLFDGLNNQVFNAPIDLFIEYDMHREYPDMRAYQFLSLERLLDEAVQATTDKRIVELAPVDVVSKSKVYNLTLAMLYRELYGVDRLADFNAAGLEKQQAQRLYEEFMEYRVDREPGEEYEVVRHWAEDLKLTPYFELLKEEAYDGQATPVDAQLDRIEQDPLDLHSNDPERDRELDTFQKGQAAIGTNMAVVMFMVDALKFFKTMDKAAIKKTAFEIAMVGTQGIAPEKQGYKLANVPGKTFSGYHLLAYYYVSFKLAVPEVLADLQLPYDAEYAMAEQLFTATP
ncbi:MAG TPA: tetratricopeptide repeat protein [Flavobacteriales bacterium]|nr:tetratricopeptide repeat protein [Flavobacteriales bacterium]